MRVTLADFQASRIPSACGRCPTDAVLLQWLNEAQLRLLPEGKWWGTYGKFRITASGGFITLPRQIATIEAAAVCHRPVPVHDSWFEFVASGAGIRGEKSCWEEANFMGSFPVFADIQNTTSKAQLQCDVAADAGALVLVLGYDQNANWIRTQQNGMWADGELIALAQSPGTMSQNYFSVVSAVQFPQVMQGQSWLYAAEQNSGTKTLIGNYQYDETRPSYRRYFFPSVQSDIQNAPAGKTVKVDIMAKLEYYPAINPSDYLVIQNLPALKDMMMAIRNAEDAPDSAAAAQEIAAGLASAKHILDMELDHYLGSGRKIGINVVTTGVVCAEPVETFL